MTRSISLKFRFFTFISIALLPFVHGYNLNDTYLSPGSFVEEPLSLTTFFEYLFANGLLRFRIPLLFLISGYLYALYDNRNYWQQVKKRTKSLLVPYLVWSAFGLAFTFCLQQNSFTAPIVAAARIDQMNDYRNYLSIGWGGILLRWLLAPVAFQLWFILSLYLYNLTYPILRWLITRCTIPWFLFCFTLFFVNYTDFIMEGRGLLFFSLGVWLQKNKFNIEKEPSWFSLGLCLILYIGVCLVKTFMAFELDALTPGNNWIIITLYQIGVICGLLSVWYGSNNLVNQVMKNSFLSKQSTHSFFIFGLHVPLLPYVMKWATLYFQWLPNYRLITYLLVPTVVLLFCLFMANVFYRYFPKIYHVLTGGRSL